MTLLNADKWLFQVLTNDAQLATALNGRVYVDVAPSNTEYPFVVVTLVASNQVGNAYADRVFDNELWQVAVWGEGASYVALEPVVDRIRAALHKTTGTGVLCAVYESARRMSETEGGKVFKVIFLEFRIFTQ